VSPWWLIISYFVIEIGELALSPVGLSVVTKLAPARIVGLTMGLWFLSNAVGNKLAGWAAGFFSSVPLPRLFGYDAAVMFVAALILAVLIRPVKSLMGGIR
jgi:POT family proton-dependent oligopeptide transporter